MEGIGKLTLTIEAGRGASSTPQGAFSRPELEFQAKQHEYFRISRISPSTGQWLLESEPFVDWRDGASRKLWAYGIRKFTKGVEK